MAPGTLSRILQDGITNAPSGIHHIPSFNDFCSGVEEDVEAEIKATITSSDSKSPADSFAGQEHGEEARGASRGLGVERSYVDVMSHSRPNEDVWRSTFNPGTNQRLSSRRLTRDYYDTVPVGGTAPTTWEYIVRSEQLKTAPPPDTDATRDSALNRQEAQEAQEKPVVGAGQGADSRRIDVDEFVRVAELSQE